MHILVHYTIEPLPFYDILFLLQISCIAIPYPEGAISNQLSLFNIIWWILKSLSLIYIFLQNRLWYSTDLHIKDETEFDIFLSIFRFLLLIGYFYMFLPHETQPCLFFFKSSMQRVTCANELAFIKQNVYRI